ncbi:MAG: hypothetical protein IKS62_04115 [Aeriscardovia sp.]|nr:hypothetical protein [Aeriscardovia sp.]
MYSEAAAALLKSQERNRQIQADKERASDKKRRTALEYGNVLIVIFSSYSVYFRMSNAVIVVFEVLLLLSALSLVRFSKRQKMRENYVKAIAIAAISGLFILLIDVFAGIPDGGMVYMAQKLFYLCALVPMYTFLFASMGIEHFRKTYLSRLTWVFALISAIGLVIYVVGVLLHVPLPKLSMPFTWGGHHQAEGLLGLVFEIQQGNLLGLHTWRYLLFFVEGPAANLAFLTGLMIELFLAPRTRPWIVVTFALSDLCTASTTAYICLPAVLLMSFFYSKRFVDLKNRSMLAAFLKWLFIVGIIVIAPIYVRYELVTKSNVGSLNGHMEGFNVGISAFLSSPLVGSGITSYGNSTSMFQLAHEGGFLLLSLYCYPLLHFIWQSIELRNMRLFVFIAVECVLFVVAIVGDSPLFAVVLAMSYAFTAKDWAASTIPE